MKPTTAIEGAGGLEAAAFAAADAVLRHRPDQTAAYALWVVARELVPASRAGRLCRLVRNGARSQRACLWCGAEGPTWCGRFPETQGARAWARAHVQGHVDEFRAWQRARRAGCQCPPCQDEGPDHVGPTGHAQCYHGGAAVCPGRSGGPDAPGVAS